ncbi:MAG: DUF3486 family protein [Magnetococcus sp. YQC-5]
MGRQSTMTRLPREIQDEISRMIREGGYTLDEIRAHLATLGTATPSRSALGRYRKSMDDRLALAREAREVAAVWVEKLGSDPQGDVGRLLVEMLRTVAFQSVSAMGEGEAAVKPSDVGTLARALRDLATADKSAVDQEIAIRKKLTAEITAENRQKLAVLATGGSNLDSGTLDEVRRVLGVAP